MGITLLIIGILLLGYLLIATEHLTSVNKAAVAVFVCTVGWVLYICYGADFVMREHAAEYAAFLQGAEASSVNVKEFIASSIFLKYVGRACEVMLFLMATQKIVEILDQNECFDFITHRLATRRSRRLLWLLSVTTLLISANLDNFTTTVMMLVVMRKLVASRSQRLYYGGAIVVAANCGGALTVIGTPTGLMLWNNGLVTASQYFLSVALPLLVAWVLPTWWIGRSLPEHVESGERLMGYRGDDCRLSGRQRALMLTLGIGGLWFIPTFHNITKLSPFLGALCVLSIIWVVNEVCNRHLLAIDSMTDRRVPKALTYGSSQVIYFVLGMMMAVAVVKETGAMDDLWAWLMAQGITPTMVALTSGVVSCALDNFATAASYAILNPDTTLNASYYSLVAYLTTAAGSTLLFGSMAGIALMKAEKVRASWYAAHIGWKALVGTAAGAAVMLVMI